VVGSHERRNLKRAEQQGKSRVDRENKSLESVRGKRREMTSRERHAGLRNMDPLKLKGSKKYGKKKKSQSEERKDAYGKRRQKEKKRGTRKVKGTG